MWKSFLKFIFFIFSVFLIFSCGTTKNQISEIEITGIFDDGIYSYSFERITESVQTESLFRASGMDFLQIQSKISSGNAIVLKNRQFVLPEFYGKTEILTINKDGTISSPTNESISGKGLKDGRIAWTGTFEEHGQTVQISEYALMLPEYKNLLAPTSFNGKYKVKLNKTFGELEFELKDGLAKSDVSTFTVNKDGEFRSHFSMKMIQKMGENTQANTLSEYSAFGKINADGSISYKMYSETNGNVETNSNSLAFTGTKIANVVNDDNFKDSLETPEKINDKNRPKWFNFQPQFTKNTITVCAKKAAKDKQTAKKIALATALSEVTSQKAIDVKTELAINENTSSKNASRSLQELIEIESSSKVEYKILKEYFDEKTGNFYIKIESKI